MTSPAFLRIYFHVRLNGCAPPPLGAPVATYRDGALYEWTLSLSTKRILELEGLETPVSFCAKVVDTGVYATLDDDMRPRCGAVSGYVPAFFPGQHWGDYLELDIAPGGFVANWGASAEEVGHACAALSTLCDRDDAFEAFCIRRHAPDLWKQVSGDTNRVRAAYHMMSAVFNCRTYHEDYAAFQKETNAKSQV